MSRWRSCGEPPLARPRSRQGDCRVGSLVASRRRLAAGVTGTTRRPVLANGSTAPSNSTEGTPSCAHHRARPRRLRRVGELERGRRARCSTPAIRRRRRQPAARRERGRRRRQRRGPHHRRPGGARRPLLRRHGDLATSTATPARHRPRRRRGLRARRGRERVAAVGDVPGEHAGRRGAADPARRRHDRPVDRPRPLPRPVLRRRAGRPRRRRMAVTQRPATLEALPGPPPACRGWRRSLVVRVGEEDRNIPAALEHYMAKRAGARRTIEIPSASHAVSVAHPRPRRTSPRGRG